MTVDETAVTRERERACEKTLRAAMDAIFRDDEGLRAFVSRRLPKGLDHMASSALKLDSKIEGVLDWARQNAEWSLLARSLYLQFAHVEEARTAARLCLGDLSPGCPVGPVLLPKPHLLDKSWPVLDREELWRTILEMEERSRSNVLLVMGPPRSGKSFTTMLLRHAAELFDLTLVTPRVQASSGGATPLALARRILSVLGLPTDSLPSPSSEDGTLDPEDLAHSLCGLLLKCPRRTWIAVDATRMGDLSFSDEMDAFLTVLADLVFETLRNNVRLVLIGVSEMSACNERRYERFTLRLLCRGDVQKLFKEIAVARRSGAPDPPDDAARRAWEAFNAHAPGDDIAPLQVDDALLDRICQVVEQHLTTGAAA